MIAPVSIVQQTPIITNNVNHFLAISEKFSIAGVFDLFSDRWSIKPSFDVFPPPYNPNEPDQPKVALPTLQAPS
ncbi:hypothetical protein [Rhizobium leguminosarum]|uniref:hypothetical protein n=1 Tax=Rhizobium leguminosarum TaxID=384 RepID=UPI001C94A7B8|nr:hypothetical protein [Rhizobium leguminosarum]MBY5439063.1 hypothetical protein [Rhizobium leguminosarum]